MRLKRRQYPAKLLLFGEYGILTGLDALAVPFPEYSGRLELTKQQPDVNLQNLLNYLKKIAWHFPYRIKLDILEEHINKGLRFNSKIPLNYGLGSSGALVAAIFENYLEKKSLDSITDPRALKTSLALIESHYHGVSSGIDPMVALLKKPVLVRRSGKVLLLETPVIRRRKNLYFFLLDSKQEGKTDYLVTGFLDKMNTPEFSGKFTNGYKRFSNAAIRNLLNGKYPDFYSKFCELSEFQIKNMSELIPEHIQAFFKEGIETGEYALKICGSGGGGYFLGICQNKEVLDRFDKANLLLL